MDKSSTDATENRSERRDRLAYGIREAACESGLGRSTLYALMAEGQIPYVKVRNRRLILADDLSAFLERHRVDP